MTDWIAVLLTEQGAAEPEEEELPELRGPVFVPGQREEEQREDAAAWLEDAALLAAGVQQTAERFPMGRGRMAEAHGMERNRPTVGGWDLPEPKVVGNWQEAAAGRLAAAAPAELWRGEGGNPWTELGAETLWRTLIRGEAALGWRGGTRVETVEETNSGGRTDLGMLDRWVEREARRYDGGFALY